MSSDPANSEFELPATMCSLPWTHTFSDPMGRIKPCCRFELDKDIRWESTDEYFKSDFANSLRQEFLAGKRPEGCRRCWQEEDAGKKSLRQRQLGDAEYVKDFDLQAPKVRYLEVSMSNLCNLACRMCDSRYSSTWFLQEEALYGKARAPIRLKKMNPLQDFGDLKDIRILKVTGGEPLLANEFFTLLEYLVSEKLAPKITLLFVTNCTVPPKPELLILFSRFKRIDITFSLDSDAALEWEYVRWPSKFTDIQKNIVDWMTSAQDHWLLSCRPTVSILNPVGAIGALQLFKNCAIKTGLKIPYTLNVTHVTHPSFLSLTVLPAELKKSLSEQILEKAKEAKDSEILRQGNYLINYMQSSDDSQSIEKTKQELSAVDSLRKQSYVENCRHLESL